MLQERVGRAEEARQQLHELVMVLEIDARRLTSEKLNLSQQVLSLLALMVKSTNTDAALAQLAACRSAPSMLGMQHSGY